MDINGRAKHIEDYLVKLHTGQWFGWSDSKNKVYANLIVLDNTKNKPSESDCTSGLETLQSDYDSAEANKIDNKASANTKLKALGLTDAEIEALKN
jgi:hypothetical protein|tara:strand:- start:567 stop:854 length:288 start_codon:yes stop_codon:yes gene_type:complete